MKYPGGDSVNIWVREVLIPYFKVTLRSLLSKIQNMRFREQGSFCGVGKGQIYQFLFFDDYDGDGCSWECQLTG